MAGSFLSHRDTKVTARLAVSCWLVYLLFLDPYPASMATDLLSLGVSFAEGAITIRTHPSADIGDGEVAVRDGKYYSGLPPAGSAVVAPVYVLLRPLLPTQPRPLLLVLSIVCTVLISAPFAALAPAVLYRCLGDLDIPDRTRLLTSVLFAFATTHFGYATGYFKENMSVALTVLAFALLVRGRHAPTERRAASWLGAGLAIGIAVATVYTSVFSAVVLGLYVVFAIGVRPALLFGAGATPPVLLLLWYHLVAFGSPFATGYTYKLGLQPHAAWFGTLDVERWVGMVLSPGWGLFPFAPIALLGLLGLIRLVLSRGAFRPEAACCVGIFTITWVVYGHYRIPVDHFIPLPHDMSLAPRYLAPTVPFLMIGLALTRDIWPAPLVRITALLTVIFGYLSAVPGLNGTWETPIIYALKVTISTFGTGMLFGQFLPEALGIDTFHTVVRSPHVGAAQLLSGPPDVLVHLVLTQLAFLALFLGAVVMVALVIARLWRTELAISSTCTTVPAARAALRWLR